MAESDDQELAEFWTWVMAQVQAQFDFLVSEFRFELRKTGIHPTQCIAEFQKGDREVGVWCSYGERPEVFVGRDGKAVFTDQLRSLTGLRDKLPVADRVFDQRMEREDYELMLKAYGRIVRAYLETDLGP